MILFIYLLIYFLLVFVIRSVWLKIKTGINPLTFNKADDAHGYNGKVFTAISFIELIIVGIYAFKIEWYKYLLPFWYIESETLSKIGWGFLIISLIVVWIAQSQMANSWRIGIDEKNKTKLVTKGLFSSFQKPNLSWNYDCEYWFVFGHSKCFYTIDYLTINNKHKYTNQVRRRIFEKESSVTDYLDYTKKVKKVDISIFVFAILN